MSLFPSDFSFCSTDRIEEKERRKKGMKRRKNGMERRKNGMEKSKWNSGGMEGIESKEFPDRME